MNRATVIIRKADDRNRVVDWAHKAPDGTRVEFKASKRTLPQNARMWALLTEIASQCLHNGKKLKPREWKILFLDLLDRETRPVQSLDGVGWVDLNKSSSDLSKSEMGDLMTLIEYYGSVNGVTFGDDRNAA